VDHKHEAVQLPIYGVMVPFHITTIKSVTSNQDNDHAYVRVSFNFSGAFDPAQRFPSAIFLKELSFRWGWRWCVCGDGDGGSGLAACMEGNLDAPDSACAVLNAAPSVPPPPPAPSAASCESGCFHAHHDQRHCQYHHRRSADVKHASRVVTDIKVLRSAVMQRDKERAERATLVQQEKLQRGKRVYRLPDLWVRPSFGGKGRKQPGALEAHANGFRWAAGGTAGAAGAAVLVGCWCCIPGPLSSAAPS
jgi:hypothetical protein